MSQRKAEAILALLVLVNSTAFLFLKIGVGELAPLNLVGLRMLVAFVVLAAFYFPRHRSMNKETLGAALVLGVCMFGVMALQACGIFTLTSSESAFLATTTVAFVPMMMAVLTRKAPSRSMVVSVLLTLGGVALICGIGPGGQGVGLSSGAIMYLVAAVVYGVHVIVVGRASQKVDLMAASVLEMGVVAALALGASFVFESPQLPATPQTWTLVIALGVFTTAIGMGFQPLVQRFTTPERYGVLFAMTPLCAAVLGFAVLGETFTPIALVGAALVLLGVMVSELSGSGIGERLRNTVLGFLPVSRVMRVRRTGRF